MSDDDLVDRVLLAGMEDGVLGPAAVRRFAEALRERARLILDERLRPVEERAAAFEKENAWKKEVIEGLETETAWKTEALARLEEDRVRMREENDALKHEIDTLRVECERATAAHDRLLAHHKAVLGGAVAALEVLPEALPWGFRRVRVRLVETAAALRREIG